MTGDEELRAAVYQAVWLPVEPVFVAVARWLCNWLN